MEATPTQTKPTPAAPARCCHGACTAEADPRSGVQSACVLHWIAPEKTPEIAADALRQRLAAGATDFAGVVFPEGTKLTDLDPPDGVCFRGAVFGSRSRFVRVRFGRKTSFREAMLGDVVAFVDCEFGDGTSFVNATLGTSFHFENCTIGDDFRMIDAQIGRQFLLKDSTLGDNAWFRSSVFEIEATVDSCRFGRGTSWHGAELPEVTFLSSEFGDETTFLAAKLPLARALGTKFGPGANLDRATLAGAVLMQTRLPGATLREADLSGTDFRKCRLGGADFLLSVVDGRTLFYECDLHEADFTGVGLASVRLYPSEQLSDIEHTMRQRSWERWYEQEPEVAKGWRVPLRFARNAGVKFFWELSDYGQSTARLIGWFAAFVVAYAAIYLIPTGFFGFGEALPGLVVGLEEPLAAGDRVGLLVRSLYFSIVTMTTLGFGDISANSANPLGEVIVCMQVVAGYVMLGALITRLGILFQSQSR